MTLTNRITNWFGFGGLSRKTGKQMVSGGSHNSAIVVNFDTAMGVSAFWASVRLLSETVAAMPLKCYKVDGATRTVTTDHPLWRLMNYQPNRYQTRTEFFESLMVNLVTDGNCYCAIERDTNGRIVSLLPLMSGQVCMTLLADGSRTYEYKTENNTVRVFSEQSIWHLKLFGNGLTGLSPLSHAAQSLGIAIATEARVTKLSQSGGKTNGILMVDHKLTPDQREAVRLNFDELTEGNADKLFVLEANMKFERTSLTPQDMQLFENRRFQIEDVARFMGVPSILINDTAGTTAWGSGIAQIMEGFYKLNLRPYLERFESSIVRNLLDRKEWGTIEIEFDFDAILRADYATRVKTQSAAVNAGLLTPNEARRQEGREPKDGGDEIYLNGSLVQAGKKGDVNG